MAKFVDPSIWNEDWYCEMPGEYQLFTKYVFDVCDNAGVWKPNKFDFETKSKFKVSLDSLFEKMNKGQQRVLLLENGRWFLTGYILFQWFNKKKSFDLLLSNRLHQSLYSILIENKISIEKVRGLKEVLKASMVMEKDIGFIKDKGDKGGMGEKEPSGNEITYPIEHCLTIAIDDQRWTESNKTNESELNEFNSYLEKQGIYDFNPMDYKRYFSHWKPKKLHPETIKLKPWKIKSA